MNKLITILVLGMFALSASAQTQSPIPETRPYCTVNKEDIELIACDFEKDANAEMVFEKGDLYFGNDETII